MPAIHAGAGIPSAGRPFDERPDYTDFDSLNALPADFDGVAGVPLNVFYRLRPHDPAWRVVGKMDSNAHLSAGHPIVDGRELFTRILIERRI